MRSFGDELVPETKFDSLEVLGKGFPGNRRNHPGVASTVPFPHVVEKRTEWQRWKTLT